MRFILPALVIIACVLAWVAIFIGLVNHSHVSQPVERDYVMTLWRIDGEGVVSRWELLSTESVCATMSQMFDNVWDATAESVSEGPWTTVTTCRPYDGETALINFEAPRLFDTQ